MQVRTTLIHLPRAAGSLRDAPHPHPHPHRLWQRVLKPRTMPVAVLSVSFFHASRLLGAGVPLLDTLDELVAEESHASARHLWHRVRTRVDQGQTLASALAGSGSGLGAEHLAALAAAEAAGTLGCALMDVEAQLRWRMEQGRRLKNALIYPLLTLLVIGAASAWLWLKVAPSVAQLNASLPGAPAMHASVITESGSSVGLAAGVFGFLGKTVLPALLPWLGYGLLTLLPGLSLMMVFGGWHPSTARLRAGLALKMPVLGRLRLLAQCAGFCRIMALLLGQGMGLLAAWPLAQASVGNRLLRQELNRAQLAVLEGCPVGQAMRSCTRMPGIMRRLVAAGDSAGALEAAFTQAAEQLNRTLQHELARLEQLLQPVLLLLMGGVLAWLVTRILGPAYGLLLNTGAWS